MHYSKSIGCWSMECSIHYSMDEDGRRNFGNVTDARSVFERSLKQFSSKSPVKKWLRRACELAESWLGNTRQSQILHNWYIRESLNNVSRSAHADDGFLSSFNDFSSTTVKSTPEQYASDDGSELKCIVLVRKWMAKFGWIMRILKGRYLWLEWKRIKRRIVVKMSNYKL